jgi:hypothetical protein
VTRDLDNEAKPLTTEQTPEPDARNHLFWVGRLLGLLNAPQLDEVLAWTGAPLWLLALGQQHKHWSEAAARCAREQCDE